MIKDIFKVEFFHWLYNKIWKRIAKKEFFKSFFKTTRQPHLVKNNTDIKKNWIEYCNKSFFTYNYTRAFFVEVNLTFQ
jgi:hypothetical protein